MKEWWTPADIADAQFPCMPKTDRAVRGIAERERWAHRKNLKGDPLARRRSGKGGGLEYHYSLLPDVVQPLIVAKLAKTEKTLVPAKPKNHLDAWEYFDRLPTKRKDKARNKLRILTIVQTLHLQGGLNKDDAVSQVAGMEGVSKATIYNWFDAISGLDQSDWLPFLIDRRGGRQIAAKCDPNAWSFLKADYLRLERPSFATCFERLQEAAAEHGWKLPSERTLYRRMEQEIPSAVKILLRQGEEALKRAFPPQRRDRSMFHALEAVNADGHKWDVFVRYPDGTIGRPMMVAIQDLYSNKILAWRFDRSENSDVVRLCFADVFNEYGIPDHAWLDNGRGFASKWITGGTSTRFRFKVRPEDPTGILTTLGVNVHWTTPYSGQSKPIERAFRDLCDSIAKHPKFAGAYTGNKVDAKPENYGSKAIPFDEFVRVVDQGIFRHNSRPNRNTRVCGRKKSFDQAFEDSYQNALIRKCSDEQLRECLLAAEQVRTDKRSGLIDLLGNRYHAECMLDHIGRAVTVRFDPDNLHDAVHVYRQDGSFIGTADCIDDSGFADTDAARTHGRKRREFIRTTKRAAELEQDLDLDELVALLPDLEEPEKPTTNTIQIVPVGNTLKTQEIEQEEEESPVSSEQFLSHIGAGLQLVKDDQI